MKNIFTILFTFFVMQQVTAQYSSLWGLGYIGGSNDNGIIFKMDHNAGSYEVVYNFVGGDMGSHPTCKLTEAKNGKLYGIAASGGLYNKGLIFSFDPVYNSYNIELHLTSRIGRALEAGPDGLLYSISIVNDGELVAFDPESKTLKTIYDFPKSEGISNFIEEAIKIVDDTLIYGTTRNDAKNQGVIFRYNINTNQNEILHYFADEDGQYPNASFVIVGNTMYGSTSKGGNNNRGVLFELDIPTKAYTVKQHFASIHATVSGLLHASDGYIYALSDIGGSNGGGGILKFDPVNNTLVFVEEFVGEGNLYLPTGELMETYNGKILGATRYGGTGGGLGVIYEYDPVTEKANIVQSLSDAFPFNTIIAEVGEHAVTSISIDAPETTISVDNGTLALSYSLLPEKASNQPVVWTVDDESLASISEEGVLIAKDNGVVNVTATANYGLGISASVAITISNQDGIAPVIPVETININAPTTYITSYSSTMQLDAVVSPSNATVTDVSWFVSDNSVAKVSESGLVTPLKDGSVTVTALANDGTGVFHTIDLEITNLITSLILSPSTSVIDSPGGSFDFDVQILPADASNQNIQWSVTNTNYASIDENGVLTAYRNVLGAVTVTATATDGSGIEVSQYVEIKNQPSYIAVNSVTLQSATGSNIIDTEAGTLQINSTVLPADATYPELSWTSSDTSVATVDQNGLVTAKSNGNTNIVAKAFGDRFGLLTITVTNQPNGPYILEAINFDPDSYTITEKSGVVQLSPQFTPANTTDDTTTITYFVIGDGISVSSTGLVTALQDGTSFVYAQIRNSSLQTIQSNYVTIEVSNQTDPDVSIDYLEIYSDSDSIKVKNGTLPLSAVILPLNATNKKITWSVDNSSLATIDSNGVLTALDNGLVTVYAGGDGVIASKQIRLINQEDVIPVAVIALSSEKDVLTSKNETLQFYATILPADASNKAIAWSVSDTSLADISSDGLLTAKKDGLVTVSAKAMDGSNVMASSTISIEIDVLTSTISFKALGDEVLLYPIPAKSHIIIDVKSENNIENVVIYDLMGQRYSYSDQNKLDINNLAGGQYIIEIHMEGGKIVRKAFVKE